MSCRVLGRRVEEVTLDILAGLARARGCSRLVGEYRVTAKNAMVAGLYAGLGFKPGREAGDASFFNLELAGYRRADDLPIEIQFPEMQGRPDGESRSNRQSSAIDFQGSPG